MSFRIDPRASLTREVRRIAGEELDKIITHLNSARDDPNKALHKARRRLKNLRGLIHLVRPGAEAFGRAENDRYRDMSRSLAGPRQASALIETIDRLAGGVDDATTAAELAAVRVRLVRHRAAVTYGEAGLGATIDAAVAKCIAGAAALATLALPDLPEKAADVLAEGALATLRRIRVAMEQSRKRGRTDDFHDLRKAVKTHAAHLSLLRRLWPSPVKPRLKRVDGLGEILGELHDVFVMRKLIETREAPFEGPESNELMKILKRSEKALRKSCLAGAEELFEDKPKQTARKLARKCRDDLTIARTGPDTSDSD